MTTLKSSEEILSKRQGKRSDETMRILNWGFSESFLSKVCPETVIDKCKRHCRCGFCVEKMKATGLKNLKAALRFSVCKHSQKSHVADIGKEGNATYQQCQQAKASYNAVECNAQLYLLNNVDGHESKFDTDNATHFPLKPTENVRLLDASVIHGEALGFKDTITSTPQGSRIRKISGPATNCKAGAKRVPSRGGMYEVVEEKTWKDVLPSATFSSYSLFSEEGTQCPYNHDGCDGKFSLCEKCGEVGKMETVESIGEMEERDELPLNADGKTDMRELELIPRIGTQERPMPEHWMSHWAAALKPWEQKHPSAKYVMQGTQEKLYKEDLTRRDAEGGVVSELEEYHLFMKRVEKLKYEAKKGQPYRERLEVRPRYIVPDVECTKRGTTSTLRTRKVEYKGTALRFTGNCMPKPFDMFPPKGFGSSMLCSIEKTAERVYGPKGAYRLVETSHPSLFVHTKTKEGKERQENFITNNPAQTETGVLFTNKHVLSPDWVRVEIPVDPATETQAYQTVLLQDTATKEEVEHHYRVVTVPRDGTYNEPSVRAMLLLDGYDGNDNLSLYRETMAGHFLRMAHTKRREFVRLVRGGAVKSRETHTEVLDNDNYGGDTGNGYVTSTSDEARRRIANLKAQQMLRESNEHAYEAHCVVNVADAWASTQEWLRSENQSIMAKQELSQEVHNTKDGLHGNVKDCTFLRLTADPNFAFVEKWGSAKYECEVPTGNIFRVALANLILRKKKKDMVPFVPPVVAKVYRCLDAVYMAESSSNLSLVWDAELTNIETAKVEVKFFANLLWTLATTSKLERGMLGQCCASLKDSIKLYQKSSGYWYIRTKKVDYYIGKLKSKDWNLALNVCKDEVLDCLKQERSEYRKAFNEVMNKHHHNRRHKGRAAGKVVHGVAIPGCRECIGYMAEAEELVRYNLGRMTRKHAAKYKTWFIKTTLCLMAGAAFGRWGHDTLDLSDTDVRDSIRDAVIDKLVKAYGIVDLGSDNDLSMYDDDLTPLLFENTFSEVEIDKEKEQKEKEKKEREEEDESEESEASEEDETEVSTRLATVEGTYESEDDDEDSVTAELREALGLRNSELFVETFNEFAKVYTNLRWKGVLDIGLKHNPLPVFLPRPSDDLDLFLDMERLANAGLTLSEREMLKHADTELLSEPLKRKLGRIWYEYIVEKEEIGRRGFAWYVRHRAITKRPCHRLPTTVNVNERGSER